MKFKFLMPLCITLTVIILFHYTKIFAAKLYPVAVNFVICTVFWSSLFTKETIIQKFAKALDGELNDFGLVYTKNLTYIWCVFLLINFLISVWTIFLNEHIWAIYNGFISYILLGTLFIVEYTIRRILKKKKIL